MTTVQIAPPYAVFNDSNGTPLNTGYLYFGVVQLNPETAPIAVYWDSNLTIPAAQPIRTINGFPSRDGSPATLYASGAFSVTVRDKNFNVISYSPIGYYVNSEQAASGYAEQARHYAEYLQSYIDKVVMNITFPLDLGFVTDPSVYNHFDLGAV